MIEEFDDIRTKQFISSIKVLIKERLLIRFKNGTESVQLQRKKTLENKVIRLPDGNSTDTSNKMRRETDDWMPKRGV